MSCVKKQFAKIEHSSVLAVIWLRLIAYINHSFISDYKDQETGLRIKLSCIRCNIETYIKDQLKSFVVSRVLLSDSVYIGGFRFHLRYQSNICPCLELGNV